MQIIAAHSEKKAWKICSSRDMEYLGIRLAKVIYIRHLKINY